MAILPQLASPGNDEVRVVADNRAAYAEELVRAGRVRRQIDAFAVDPLNPPGAIRRVWIGPSGELRCGCRDFQARRDPSFQCEHVLAVLLALDQAEADEVRDDGPSFTFDDVPEDAPLLPQRSSEAPAYLRRKAAEHRKQAEELEAAARCLENALGDDGLEPPPSASAALAVYDAARCAVIGNTVLQPSV